MPDAFPLSFRVPARHAEESPALRAVVDFFADVDRDLDLAGAEVFPAQLKLAVGADEAAGLAADEAVADFFRHAPGGRISRRGARAGRAQVAPAVHGGA